MADVSVLDESWAAGAVGGGDGGEDRGADVCEGVVGDG